MFDDPALQRVVAPKAGAFRSWSELPESVDITLPLPPGTKTRDLVVELAAEALCVWHGERGVLLEARPLAGHVVSDESTWYNDGEMLHITLHKQPRDGSRADQYWGSRLASLPGTFRCYLTPEELEIRSAEVEEAAEALREKEKQERAEAAAKEKAEAAAREKADAAPRRSGGKQRKGKGGKGKKAAGGGGGGGGGGGAPAGAGELDALDGDVGAASSSTARFTELDDDDDDDDDAPATQKGRGGGGGAAEGSPGESDSQEEGEEAVEWEPYSWREWGEDNAHLIAAITAVALGTLRFSVFVRQLLALRGGGGAREGEAAADAAAPGWSL